MRVTDGDDHYAVLGLTADATPEQIRDAYRTLARRLHPDRTARRDAADRMARLNEAYYVLRDPGRRAIYDSARRPSSSAAGLSDTRPPSPPVDEPVFIPSPPGRARFPWRWVLVFAAAGSILVGGLSVLVEPARAPEPDNLLKIGSCVAIEANGDARETPCSRGDELVVREIVSFDETCPYGMSGHRDRQGLGIACVSPSSADEDE